MTFENLPTHWDRLSLTDPGLASDVVDLFLADRDRRRNSLLVLVCDPQDRLLQPMVINDIDWRCSALRRRRTFEFLQPFSDVGVIIAASSPRRIAADVVERWRQTTADVCTDGGSKLIHFFSAVPHEQPLLADPSQPSTAAS